ncbi:L-threonylcarbamoyladenylate synthase [Bryocella elongata]|uniref:Threonylcarbamoyl-AMP synthase n=1 Tax=Bryocella elongata TaxID=863522 RepID=A0A1H5TVZ2_9BACT|nr:L-threonylcarbamoyladenylate synthase [Bryocella elongata]SEF66201.1 L-threonylcarbamoyladenylate synthase [Bryocella elongata]
MLPETLHLYADQAGDLPRAAELLQAGGLVAFATETVYGLGANALMPAAVAAIFSAKGRPAWDPVIVHLATVEQLAVVAAVPTELATRVARLTEAFWPGPLTLLLPRTEAIGDAVTAGRPLVGVRIPAHPAAQALLAAAGVPVAAPSANRFGHTSPTTAAHVLADLDGRIDAVLDAGPTRIGVESTVLDPTQTPMVLYRPGAISAEELAKATGVAVEVYVASATCSSNEPSSLPSPGVGIRHYAPQARVVLVEPLTGDLASTLLEPASKAKDSGDRVGLLLPDGWAHLSGSQTVAWGDWDVPETLAANLFAGLRELDARGVDVILVPLPPSGGIRDAILDRLNKAARPS